MSRDIPDPSTLADRAIARAQRLEVVEKERDRANEDALALAYEAERYRAERNAARGALCALLDALGSGREAAAVAEAMETRRGWGL